MSTATSHSSLQWQILPAAQFPAYAAAWQACNQATLDTPLLAPEMVQAALDHLASGKELLAICRMDGAIAAMAVLTPTRHGVWASFQPSQAPLGFWMHRADLPLERLCARLQDSLPGLPLVLSLTQRDPLLESPPVPTAGLAVDDYIQTSGISLAGSFDDYWQARGKNLRSNLKKQRSRLQRDGLATRLEETRREADMAAAVADFGRLEMAGWKGERGTAVCPGTPQGSFYRAMLEGFARRDRARVFRYWFGTQLVAMDLCIESDDMLVVLKTAYDETVPAALSPSLLMREDCMRLLFEERRLPRLEFYGRLMEWHTRWTNEIRTMYHVSFYRWPGLQRLHALAKQRHVLLERLRGRPATTPVTE